MSVVAVAELCLQSVKAFSFPTLLPQRVYQAWPRGWEVTHPGQLKPNDQRDIPYHMKLCSAIKVQGKEDEAVTFRGHSL